jgi:glyceraldehyde 3-phosphate dehydrogenase
MRSLVGEGEMKIAINGFGRIGRAVLRAWYERKFFEQGVECVAINCGNFGDLAINLHLLQYDSIHGTLHPVSLLTDDTFMVGTHEMSAMFHNEIASITWSDYNVDVVLECTGKFTSRNKAVQHIEHGAKKVMVSAPCSDADATIVYGVNDGTLSENHQVISIGSCTTNCLAPLAKLMHENFGIESGFMTTIHAYTNDQVLLDSIHTDPRRARSAGLSMIPTSTGAAEAIGLVIPELAGKLDGNAIRVPVPNVSFLELTLNLKKSASVDGINQCVQGASQGVMREVLAYNAIPLVSIDFNHNLKSCVFDATQTKVLNGGYMCKVSAWYDNEWGFANRMLDVLKVWG